MKTYALREKRATIVLTPPPATVEFVRLISATGVLFGLLAASHAFTG